MQTAERLNALMEHLGLEAAHFATQVPGDIAGLASGRPDRIKGLVLCVPMRLDARPFERVASRLLMISGELGLSAQMTLSAQEHLPAAQRHILRGYNAEGWSDVVADRTAEVAGAIVRFLTSATEQATSRVPLAARSGTHAGLTYRIEGQGPALILLPFFLAPSQWQPALPELTRHFTVIQLGGPHIGGVAALEDRARAPTYQAMFRTLVDLMAPEAGSRILDVGCGSGALDRLLAARLGATARIDAVDVNPFLLREAADLAADLAERIRFAPGSALALPFADRTFDCIFSVTVLEECDADRGDRRDDARRAAGRPHRARGARHRHCAMVEFAAAGRTQGEGRNTSAVGRSRRRGGCQPVRAHASGGTREPARISRAHHAR